MSLLVFMEIGKEVELKNFSRLQIGGPARDLVRADTVDELIDAAKTARELRMPIFILGGGTNILWSDNGYDGLVLMPFLTFMEIDDTRVTAGSGVEMANLVGSTVSRGLAGLEWAGGLPGTVGGAIYGNAGAFGGEIKDSLLEVVSLDLDSFKLKHRLAGECKFGYRTSVFKSERLNEVILHAIFKLTHGNKLYLSRKMDSAINYRKATHPLEYPNIGSIFKNVAVSGIDRNLAKLYENAVKTDPFPLIPAAYLIDKAGMKGARVGGALVSPKQPNFIVNVENASDRDVLRLIDMVTEKVYINCGVRLEKEVRIMA